jgi:hypothetical protein
MAGLTASLKQKLKLGVGNIPLHKPIAYDQKFNAVADPQPGSHPFKEAHLIMRESGLVGPPVVSSVKHETASRKAFMSAQSAIMTKYGPGLRVTGSEYLTSLVVPTGGPGRGSCLYSVPINPFVITDARLQLMSQMYTRFIFRRFRVTYEPTAGTQNNGSIMLFGDYDPAQNASLAGGDNSLRYAFTHNCRECSIWEEQSVTITDAPYDEMLYVDPTEELRWCFQGNFWCLLAGSTSNTAALEMGKFILDYEIDFAVPDYGGPLTMPNSTFSYSASIPTLVIGSSFKINGLPISTLCFVTIQSITGLVPANPTLYKNSSDYYLGNVSAGFNLTVGQGFYVYTQYSGTSFVYTDPAIWNQDNLAAEGVYTGSAITTGSTTLLLNVFPLPLPYAN